MSIEFYILGLMKFKDDQILFTEMDLEVIAQSINSGLHSNGLITQGYKKQGGYFIYSLDPHKLIPQQAKEARVISANLGYYHHRILAHLTVELEGDFYVFRQIRDSIRTNIDSVIERYIKSKINELSQQNTIRNEAYIDFVYTYPLIVQNLKNKKEDFPFSEQTGSLSFSIIEPSLIKPGGKQHIVRTSYASANLYTDGKAGDVLLRDLVNAIYLYVLYEKKQIDDKTKKFNNELDEHLLTNFWTHAIDVMGAKTGEVYSNIVTQLTYFISLIALVVSLLALVQSVLNR